MISLTSGMLAQVSDSGAYDPIVYEFKGIFSIRAIRPSLNALRGNNPTNATLFSKNKTDIEVCS